MASESSSELELGHVLFVDIVGYSKLLVDEQSNVARQLNQIVRDTDQVRNAEAKGKLIRLPTGDGMALVFFTNPEAPMQCALEISRALKQHPAIKLRMGLHSGPVNAVSDVNERENVAGVGINLAQRVMNCGDAGHILLSKRVAEDLAQYTRWRDHLHALEQLAKVVTIPGAMGTVPTYGDLRFNPCWDDLRADPRFDEIVAAAKAASR